MKLTKTLKDVFKKGAAALKGENYATNRSAFISRTSLYQWAMG